MPLPPPRLYKWGVSLRQLWMTTQNYPVESELGNPKPLRNRGKKAIANPVTCHGAEAGWSNAFPGYRGEVSYAISPAKIMESIAEHPDLASVAVIFSGDIGFYSGAKKLNQAIAEQKPEYEVEFIPGISSLQYFSAKLKLPWEDAKVVSLHGREDNIPGTVRNHKKVFFLTGGDCTVQKICSVLSAHDLPEAIVHVGERLSDPDVRIVTAKAERLSKEEFDSLAVRLVENERTLQRTVNTHGIEDERFLRGQVPMTKSEIRSISLSKLQLRPGDVVYDIGAGTGSVSVEMALQAYEGSVFAVECNEEALALIRQNTERFGAWNVKTVAGKAPEALAELPAPDRAFIGGSKGNLPEIMALLIQKNPRIRVVINAVTLETLAEAVSQFQKLGFGISTCSDLAAHGLAAGSYL